MIQPRRKILALGLLLMIINRLSGLVLPFSTQYLIDNVIGKKQIDLLTPLVLAVLGATLIQGITSYSPHADSLQSRAATDRRTAPQSPAAHRPVAGLLLRHQQDRHAGLAHHDRRGRHAQSDRHRAGRIRRRPADRRISLVVLLRISPAMTIVTAVAVGAFAFVLSKAFTNIRPIFRERGKINAEVTGRLTESLGGVRVVKGYHAEEREAEVFGKGVQRLLDNVLKIPDRDIVHEPVGHGADGHGGRRRSCTSARARSPPAHMTLGDFMTFTAFLAFLIAPVFQIVGIGTQIPRRSPASTARAKCWTSGPRIRTRGAPSSLGPIQGTVAFDHVNFAYEAGKPVLYDVSFHAEPGTVTALVGSSGSGKSTIIGLIAAFHTPTSGTVIVDGMDLSTVRLDTYRTQFGVVLQETFLFDGSIGENIAFARPGATEEQILEACRIARVDEFAEGFEKGYDTIVGERGVKLSGGQRQRVSIARAILADPRILILDEATSSLDSESEALIQEGLKYLMQGRTTFVIAHRLSTIRRADQILVVEAGRIVERGTHETLFARTAAIGISTPGSTAWKRICFSRRAKATRSPKRIGAARLARRPPWPKRCVCCAAARSRSRRSTATWLRLVCSSVPSKFRNAQPV